MSDRNLVIVTGMPGSGEAAVSGALSRLGVFFGSQDDFPLPSPDEPGGAFEHRAWTNFNHRCLNAFQLHPMAIASMPTAWRSLPQAHMLRKELTDLLAGTIQNHALPGINQPMASLLSPLYTDVFGELKIVPHYVVCVRDPAELTDLPLRWSHETGSRPVPPLGPLAIGVWLRHTLGALEAAEQDRLSVVSYEDLFDDPGPILDRIVQVHPGWSPSSDQIAAAVALVSGQGQRKNVHSEALGAYPDFVAETLNLCRELGRGASIHDKIRGVLDEFNLWREMLAPPGNPGTRMGFAWVDGGVTQTAQVPFLPSGDWQTVRLLIAAPPNKVISGLLYGRPCRVWIRRCVWFSKKTEEPAMLTCGPGSRLQNLGGLLRLEGASESQQVSLRTPSRLGPFELEIEFLLEAGPQINVETAHRLADRLRQCTAVLESKVLAGQPSRDSSKR